jgi:hypothetical protein
MVAAVWMMRHQVTTRRDESDDPILALMRHLDLPITRQDYLNVAYLGHPPEELSVEEEADLPKEVR